MQKDYDKIKQENAKYKLNSKNNIINDKLNKDFSKLSQEYNDSCRLNEILDKENKELKNSKELLVKENYNLKVLIDSIKKENINLRRTNGFLSKGVEDICPYKSLHTNVYSSFIHNCQIPEAIMISFCR